MSGSRGAARTAALLGALAVIAIPVAVAVAQVRSDVGLLGALYAGIPAAFVLAIAALISSRRARLALARSVAPGSRAVLRAGRFLAWAGVYAGCTGGVALAVYGVLRWAQ